MSCPPVDNSLGQRFAGNQSAPYVCDVTFSLVNRKVTNSIEMYKRVCSNKELDINRSRNCGFDRRTTFLRVSSLPVLLLNKKNNNNEIKFRNHPKIISTSQPPIKRNAKILVII